MNFFELLLLLLLQNASAALNSDKNSVFQFNEKSKIVIFGDERKLNQSGFSSIQKTHDLYILGDIDFTISHKSIPLKFEVQPQIRGLVSSALSEKGDSPANLTVTSPTRFFTIQKKIRTSDQEQWLLDLERLDLTYGLNNGEIFIGRRPLGVGVMHIFPIWNKFTKNLPTINGFPLVFNPDVLGLRLQNENIAVQSFTLFTDSQKNNVQWIEPIFYSSNFEFHFLVSRWWEEMTAGFATSGNVGDMTVRLESLTIGSKTTQTKKQIQIGLGGDYVFDENWSLTNEYYYQSNGLTTSGKYTLIPLSKFNSLQSLLYTIIQGQYKFNSLWTSTFGSLINTIDGSQSVIFRLDHSLSDNSDFYFNTFFPLGNKGSEFSKQTIMNPNGTFIGYSSQISLGLEMYF